MGTHPIFESDFDCLTDSSMSKQLSKEEIVQHYQGLCQESRQMQQKRAELNQERGEHELVAKTLRKADSDRKCWRLIGGVLTERTVGQVLPAVETQVENISSVIKMLEDKIGEKAKEITAYREQHQILVQGRSGRGIGRWQIGRPCRIEEKHPRTNIFLFL